MEYSEDTINEFVRKTTSFFTDSWRIKEDLFFEVETTLLTTYPPKLMATILKTLREQLKENDQMNAVEEVAGPVPEIPH